MIIFASYRDTMSSIVDALKKEGIPCTKFVGQSNSKTGGKRSFPRRTSQSNGSIQVRGVRVLVSTSIEERVGCPLY